MNNEQLLRYSRHILLEQIDVDGQDVWSRAKVMVVGCGGLGSTALAILAASGIGELIIIDDDVLELSNLQRQILYRQYNLNQLKVKAAEEQIKQINADVKVTAIAQRVDENRLFDLVAQVDIVLDCTDNFATRQAINKACFLQHKVLVSGAAVRFSGQLAIYDFTDPNSPCYKCFFEQEDADDGVCALMGIFSPVVSIIGAMQAAETLKILLGLPYTIGELNCFDALNNTWQKFTIMKNKHCSLCANSEHWHCL